MTNKEFLNKLKLINDETRLSILQILSQNGTLCGCKILEALHITQGTLSHHMKLLAQTNLVTCKKEGKWCFYTLNKQNICDLALFIEDICNSEGYNGCGCK